MTHPPPPHPLDCQCSLCWQQGRRDWTGLALCLLLACSSPAPPVPADAGSECQRCRDDCSSPVCAESECRKVVAMCSYACARLCESEGR